MTPPAHHQHDPAVADGHTEGHDTDAEMGRMLELESSATGALVDEISTWLRHRVTLPGREPQIADLGSGVGSATVALARRFGNAQVTAVDRSPDLLAAVRERAIIENLAGRVRTVEADLDGAWPELGPVDLVWSSMALHHLADPEHGLLQVRGWLREGGLVAVVEMGEPVRLLPDDLGRGEPGLQRRLQSAMDEVSVAHLPSLGSDWGERLTRAGFQLVERREFRIDVPPGSLSGVQRRFGDFWLRRLLQHLGPSLRQEDRELLGALLDDGGLAGFLQRDDVFLTGSRIVWLGRRP